MNAKAIQKKLKEYYRTSTPLQILKEFEGLGVEFEINSTNNMKIPEFYTENELTSFGEYLLSAQRLETLHPDADPAGVYHSDVENWKAKVGGAGVEMGEEVQGIQPDLSAWQQSK